MRRRGKIVVLHLVGQMPLAGMAWQAVNYLSGLAKLGFEPWYVEDHGINPYDPRSNSVVMDCADNVAYLRAVMERHGLAGRWAYHDAINDVWHGLSAARVRVLYAEAAGLINLCGAAHMNEDRLRCPVRLIIDTDPVYEQIKYAKADAATRAYLGAHTHFFTYGANLGTALCPIPLSGVDWRPTRPPVDLDLWPSGDGEPPCFTTIATWENKGKNVEFEGETYVWSKHENFLRFLDVPRHRPGARFTMAVLPPDPSLRRRIEEAGWHLVDSGPLSADMENYRAFIAGSRGEFTVAKDIYVRPNSGWFSDRAVCYLASGRPVVTMRTGFTSYCPVGEGLFDFASRDEALAAVDRLAADYPRHSRAARGLAAEVFDAERVVGAMMREAGL